MSEGEGEGSSMVILLNALLDGLVDAFVDALADDLIDFPLFLLGLQ
jgi:hypothetical protein